MPFDNFYVSFYRKFLFKLFLYILRYMPNEQQWVLPPTYHYCLFCCKNLKNRKMSEIWQCMCELNILQRHYLRHFLQLLSKVLRKSWGWLYDNLYIQQQMCNNFRNLMYTLKTKAQCVLISVSHIGVLPRKILSRSAITNTWCSLLFMKVCLIAIVMCNHLIMYWQERFHWG